jgi:thiamine biosynthesis lipoprotein
MQRQPVTREEFSMIRRAKPLLGTLVEIRLGGLEAAAAQHAIDRAFAAVSAVHGLMSFHEPTSDVSRLNREAAAATIAVDVRTYAVLRRARDIAEASGGLFDITTAGRLVAWGFLPRPAGAPAPDPAATWRDIHLEEGPEGGRVRFARPLWIDLGGIAKGYAVDAAIQAMLLHEGAQAVVNAGGDLRVTGPQPEQARLRLPLPTDAIPVIEIAEGSLASSSGREHIRSHDGQAVGPHVHGISGASIVDRFVSVTAQECVVADALTKVVMAAGEAASAVLDHYGAAAYVYENDRGWTVVGSVGSESLNERTS